MTIRPNAGARQQCRTCPRGVLLVAVLFASMATAQEVAEIPFVNAPPGTAALGGGIRFGQSPYRASDNEDERQLDLIPLYLYEGKYLSLIHISEPTRRRDSSRMPSSA